MATQIKKLLLRGTGVICTVNINLDHVTKNGKLKIGKFTYIPIYEITPEFLERYALENHVKGKEHQTYVFIDECQLIFNTRDWAQSGRRDWLVFFTSHRHYGYEFFLITQDIEMLDKQVRALVESEIKHIKLNNYVWFLPVTLFKAVETWNGSTKPIKMNTEYILFRKSVSRMYDSYVLFDDLKKKYPDVLTPEEREKYNLIALYEDSGDIRDPHEMYPDMPSPPEETT